jgi:hypothetical protein
MHDEKQSAPGQIEPSDVAPVSEVGVDPTQTGSLSAGQLNSELGAIHAPIQARPEPVDANQITPGWDERPGPETSGLDQIANAAPELSSAWVHEMGPSPNIYPCNSSIHGRDGASVLAMLDGNQGRSAWLVAGALVAAFGLGWAGGLNSYRFLTLDAALNPVPQQVKSSPRIPDSERESVARIDGLVRSTTSEAGSQAPTILKVSSPAANTPGHAYKPSAGATQLGAASSSTVSSVEQANTTLPGAAATQRKAMVRPAPETRPTTIEGWTVRDVRGGTAVLEGPAGVWTAARGDTVPEVGRIDSIVRWGSRWIVATTNGLISTP